MCFLIFIKKIVAISLAIVILWGCTKEGYSERPFTDDCLFPHTERIDVEQYSYYIGNKLYVVKGDLATLDDPDIFPTTPSFSWKATESKLVVVAVFNSRIEVDYKGIINKNSIVWMWNTGMGTGKEGSVGYDDGRTVSNGQILDSIDLKPLNSGGLYTWAVWAWDKTGTKVAYSSKELGFKVE